MRFHPIAWSLLIWSSATSAHVLLDEPARRYDDMKAGPCGRGAGSDGRTDRVARYRPGETITVRWNETIDHEGTWVISFDEDGADAADFAAQVLHEEPDPRDTAGLWSAEVTLPDVSCTNCTLQLVQVMTTSEPVVPSDLYFQCADLVLGDGESAPAETCASAGAPASLALCALFFGRGRRRRAR